MKCNPCKGLDRDKRGLSLEEDTLGGWNRKPRKNGKHEMLARSTDGYWQATMHKAMTEVSKLAFQAQFQLLKLLAISVTRFIGDLIGRFLVDFGGRNTYAGFQLLLCSVGAHTATSLRLGLGSTFRSVGNPVGSAYRIRSEAYRACRPLWAMERQGKEPEEEGEAWKFPRAPEDSPNPSEAFSPAPAR